MRRGRMRRNGALWIILFVSSVLTVLSVQDENMQKVNQPVCEKCDCNCVKLIKPFLERIISTTAEIRVLKIFEEEEKLYLQENMEDDKETDVCTVETKKEHLLEEYFMFWIHTKEKTLFYLSREELANAKKYVCKILSAGITNAPCTATTAPPTHDCSNISCTKTITVTPTQLSMTDASSTTSTPSAHSGRMEQNTCENCVQVYITVIVCLCSFLAGALFSLFVCMFCRSDKFGKKKANPTHDIVLDNTELPSQETSTNKIKSNKSDVKTYETLNSSPGSTPDKASTDHVYLGISSNSSLHYKSDVNRSNGKEIQPSQTYNSCKQNKEDHVYNTLKAEKTSNIYTETKATESQEHTYTGLSKREAEDLPESVNQSSLEESESIHNRSSDGHNYFILEDEVKGRGTEVTSMPYEVQDKERHMMENDDDQSEGHNYFTLEKPDHLNNPGSIIYQHDATKQPDNDNDGPTYHILEKE